MIEAALPGAAPAYVPVEARSAAISSRLGRTSPGSQAAEAAACAGDQKKFWEMPNLLFIHQHELAPEQLSGYARTIELDLPAFEKCLSSGRHEGEIRGSIRLANSLGITGTPAYVLARRIPGGDKVQVLEIVHGVPPHEELEKRSTLFWLRSRRNSSGGENA